MNGFKIEMEIGDEPDSDPVFLIHDLRNELRSADLDPCIAEGGDPAGGTKSIGSIVRWLELHGLTLDGVRAALVASAPG